MVTHILWLDNLHALPALLVMRLRTEPPHATAVVRGLTLTLLEGHAMPAITAAIPLHWLLRDVDLALSEITRIILVKLHALHAGQDRTNPRLDPVYATNVHQTPTSRTQAKLFAPPVPPEPFRLRMGRRSAACVRRASTHKRKEARFV